MSGIAGYKTQLKLGGVPTIFTDEPLTQLSDEIHRINNPIKRVISADYPVVITDDNDDEVDTAEINYLEGVFYIPLADWLSPFKVSARYIPLEYIGGSKEYSCELGGDVLDNTAFHTDDTLSAGFREKINGLHDVKVSLSRWNNFNGKLIAAKQAKTPVFISINPGGSLLFIKGWFQIETDSLAGDVGSLEEETLSLVLTGNNTKTIFSYSYNYSDADAQAMDEDDLIDNWFFGLT